MGIHDLVLFLMAGALLNITPGPDMALIVARSTQHGTRSGIIAALGVGVGAFIHISAGAMGISAIVLTSALAFAILKWIGAAYLIFLGIQMLRSPHKDKSPLKTSVSLRSAGVRQIFLQGVMTNALNPKVALFFLAFLPQFIDADAPFKVASFVVLGLLFDAVGTTWNIAVACFAGKLAASSAYPQLKVWLVRAIGTLFVLVGIKLALGDRS
jgi:threonine/homoserine/homoserine lactone efflux protein